MYSCEWRKTQPIDCWSSERVITTSFVLSKLFALQTRATILFSEHSHTLDNEFSLRTWEGAIGGLGVQHVQHVHVPLAFPMSYLHRWREIIVAFNSECLVYRASSLPGTCLRTRSERLSTRSRCGHPCRSTLYGLTLDPTQKLDFAHHVVIC